MSLIEIIFWTRWVFYFYRLFKCTWCWKSNKWF